jgi:hypothetical protein
MNSEVIQGVLWWVLDAFAVIIWMNYGLELYKIAIIFEQ